VSGVDLSPGMVAQARSAHPGLQFDVGSMTALDLPDGALAGVVAWYSIVNIPTGRLPEVFAEFARVLGPGGQVLLAFQAGDGHRHGTEWLGHDVCLDLHLRPPEQVAGLLAEAGFTVHAQLVREPVGPGEAQPRAFLLARAPEGRTPDGAQPSDDAPTQPATGAGP
jgi:ubiquinone/menaquinone biosynthesis C-methylase UbiE